MSPFQIFKLCQGTLGRKYRGDRSSFEQLNCSAFYFSLADYLKDKFGKANVAQAKFIKVCGKQLGSSFNPFELMTEEYMNVYNKWLSVHGSAESYKENIKNSIQYIYDFCRDKDITSIEEYTKRWSVSHIVSGILEENVAYILGVQELYLTKPEKKLIKKKYMDNVLDIKARLERDKEILDFIIDALDKVQNKIGK